MEKNWRESSETTSVMWELDPGPGSMTGRKDSWALAQRWTPPDMRLAVFFFWNKDHSVKRKFVSGFFPFWHLLYLHNMFFGKLNLK